MRASQSGPVAGSCGTGAKLRWPSRTFSMTELRIVDTRCTRQTTLLRRVVTKITITSRQAYRCAPYAGDVRERATLLALSDGPTPFFGLPQADFCSLGRDAYRGAAAVLLGVPYDESVTRDANVRFGPYAVRRASACMRLPSFSSISTVLDGGNLVQESQRSAMRTRIRSEVAMVLASEAVPFLVGGDSIVTVATVSALAEQYGQIAVVRVDPRCDADPVTSLLGCIADRLIEPRHLHFVASRGVPREQCAHERTIVHSMADVQALGIEAVARRIRDAVGGRALYLSFDLHAVDPAFAPGTATPIAGGLTTREALAFVRGLAGVRLVGMDVVELAPAFDRRDVTAQLAALLIGEGVQLLARRAA